MESTLLHLRAPAFIAGALFLAAINPLSAQERRTPDCGSDLELMLSRISSGELGTYDCENERKRAALELSDDAVPMLIDFVDAAPDYESMWPAVECLVIVGGDEAALRLQQLAREKPEYFAGAYSAVLATAETVEDFPHLIRSIQGEHIGDGWQNLRIAVFSMAVLRDPQTLNALETCADVNRGLVSGAAQNALRWWKDGPYEVDLPPDASEHDRLLAVAMRFGIPYKTGFDRYHDKGMRRHWIIESNRWRTEPAPEVENELPSFSSKVWQNSRGDRAIVTMNFTYGSLDGHGYDYYLRRDDNKWHVVQIHPTWIS